MLYGSKLISRNSCFFVVEENLSASAPLIVFLCVCVCVCEGTEMMDSQLMGEFEYDIKDLEADSWSGTVDKKFLKALKKDEIKRQDVIYGNSAVTHFRSEINFRVKSSCHVHTSVFSPQSYTRQSSTM